MIEQTPQAELIRRQLCDSLRQGTRDSRIVKFAKHENIFTCGEVATCSVYVIERGQVKLSTLSADGKECIVAIYTAGDVFGELCLSGAGERLETIDHRISQEELSRMVGTTRPRVSELMKRFRELGLIETHPQNGLLVRDKELREYLTKLASC